eukprot:CAMPEP_0179459490 /NCGR_PEP_ID=MMETSP0799-20121207/42808_1 /TAXON_ID=46947 /ORGANISM="Geminigera cryophila, Strain CCMP2564" /LENGTH=350 /DNA_ID=CAMNT_0021261329 /DNA_START=17 /DNA_END=1069 /DNA_ORIENTATION=+
MRMSEREPLLSQPSAGMMGNARTALVAIGALAVGMALGRHTAPQPASLLSLAGRSPAVLQAKAELELDGGRFPRETDNYLFQRIADGMPPLTGSSIYNPYLEGPNFPPSVKGYPFHDSFIPVSKESSAAEIFSLPPLSCAYEALEPYIDRYTMYLHHDKHFNAYRTNLNSALAADPELSHNLLTLQASAISGGNTAIRNNAGGFYNHGLFFSTLAPASKATQPSSALLDSINQDFGSLEGMKAEFHKKALKVFGSGWVWVGVEVGENATLGALTITSTKNQDNPLMTGVAATRLLPIFGLDVWEHAYYLEYQNKRAEYVNNFWSVLNWYAVSQNYEHFASLGSAVDWHPI